MGMLPTIGKMVGLPNAVGGFLVHMVISALIGPTFAVVLDKLATNLKSGLGVGVVYGAFWWVMGPLTMMPLRVGMAFGANVAKLVL